MISAAGLERSSGRNYTMLHFTKVNRTRTLNWFVISNSYYRYCFHGVTLCVCLFVCSSVCGSAVGHMFRSCHPAANRLELLNLRVVFSRCPMHCNFLSYSYLSTLSFVSAYRIHLTKLLSNYMFVLSRPSSSYRRTYALATASL